VTHYRIVFLLAAAGAASGDKSRTIEGHRDELEGSQAMVSASDALVPRRHHSMTTLLARHRSTCPSGDVIPATHTQVVTSSTGGQRPQQTTGNGTCLKKSLAGTIDNDRSHRATNCLTTPTTPLVQTSVIDVVGKPVGKPIERATQTRSVYLIFHFICRSFLSL